MHRFKTRPVKRAAQASLEPQEILGPHHFKARLAVMAARAAVGRQETEEAQDTGKSRRSKKNNVKCEDIYVCMRHGPMMGDTVQERYLTSRCVPGMDKKALVDIAYCLQCNLKANGWSVETSSEEDSSEQGEVLFETRSTEEEYKAREKDCFHEYKVKGANQYGSWDKCLECRAKFNYKERPKYKEKYENEAKDGKGTTTDQGDDPEKDSKPKQATASSTSASSTSATSTLPTRRQIDYLRLLAGKLKIKVEIPADIIEASMLINDLRDEVDRLGLWR